MGYRYQRNASVHALQWICRHTIQIDDIRCTKKMGIKPLSSLHLVQQLSNRKLVLVNKSQSWWYLEDNRHRYLQLTVLSVVGHHYHTLIRCSNFHHINHRMLDVFNCLNAIRVLRSIHPFFFKCGRRGYWNISQYGLVLIVVRIWHFTPILVKWSRL